MTVAVQHETCARCGHTTPDCARCGQEWPFLGAGIGDQRYCHTFVEGSGPTLLRGGAVGLGHRPVGRFAVGALAPRQRGGGMSDREYFHCGN